ncbi:E3 ubiquitin-protein ligase rnf43 [Geranomyces variabilis]|uniref:E3 ubiquitin-protein ligase rnf43 n=1 Tax=Geranomyces variabilis TaxID=109894 RepID=A0AAD5TRQ9_9FUNG|nr:E3 ubiquitin-protein ligase rnf43 [Geranomyces variabilis]
MSERRTSRANTAALSAAAAAPHGRLTTFLSVAGYLYDIANCCLRIVFLIMFPARCDPNIHAYFFTMLALDAVHLLPYKPLVWFINNHRQHWQNQQWFLHLRSFWTACQVVDTAAFLYASVGIFRPGTCREQSKHLWWLMVAETVATYTVFVGPMLVFCCLGLIFRKRIMAQRRAQMELEAQGGAAGAAPTGLTLVELSTLRTYLFGEPNRGNEPDEIRIQDLESNTGTNHDRRSTADDGNQPHVPKPKAPSIASIETCSICITEYTPGERLRELACGHRFHQECIDGWLLPDPATHSKGHRTCPLCVGPAVRQDEVAEGSEGEDKAAGAEMPELLDRLETLTNTLEPRPDRRQSLRRGGSADGTALGTSGGPTAVIAVGAVRRDSRSDSDE